MNTRKTSRNQENLRGRSTDGENIPSFSLSIRRRDQREHPGQIKECAVWSILTKSATRAQPTHPRIHEWTPGSSMDVDVPSPPSLGPWSMTDFLFLAGIVVAPFSTGIHTHQWSTQNSPPVCPGMRITQDALSANLRGMQRGHRSLSSAALVQTGIGQALSLPSAAPLFYIRISTIPRPPLWPPSHARAFGLGSHLFFLLVWRPSSGSPSRSRPCSR